MRWGRERGFPSRRGRKATTPPTRERTRTHMYNNRSRRWGGCACDGTYTLMGAAVAAPTYPKHTPPHTPPPPPLHNTHRRPRAGLRRGRGGGGGGTGPTLGGRAEVGADGRGHGVAAQGTLPDLGGARFAHAQVARGAVDQGHARCSVQTHHAVVQLEGMTHQGLPSCTRTARGGGLPHKHTHHHAQQWSPTHHHPQQWSATHHHPQQWSTTHHHAQQWSTTHHHAQQWSTTHHHAQQWSTTHHCGTTHRCTYGASRYSTSRHHLAGGSLPPPPHTHTHTKALNSSPPTPNPAPLTSQTHTPPHTTSAHTTYTHTHMPTHTLPKPPYQHRSHHVHTRISKHTHPTHTHVSPPPAPRHVHALSASRPGDRRAGSPGLQQPPRTRCHRS